MLPRRRCRIAPVAVVRHIRVDGRNGQDGDFFLRPHFRVRDDDVREHGSCVGAEQHDLVRLGGVGAGLDERHGAVLRNHGRPVDNPSIYPGFVGSRFAVKENLVHAVEFQVGFRDAHRLELAVVALEVEFPVAPCFLNVQLVVVARADDDAAVGAFGQVDIEQQMDVNLRGNLRQDNAPVGAAAVKSDAAIGIVFPILDRCAACAVEPFRVARIDICEGHGIASYATTTLPVAVMVTLASFCGDSVLELDAFAQKRTFVSATSERVSESPHAADKRADSLSA